jgi:hypothetical protein
MGQSYNVRFRLTPMPATNRWRKKYRGKIYYVGRGHCANKNDREGYAIAIAEWRELQRKLDTPVVTAEEARLVDVAEQIAELDQEVSHLLPQLTTDELTELVNEGGRGGANARLELIRRKVDSTRPPKKGTAIRWFVQEFIRMKRVRHDMGGLSAGRVACVGLALAVVEKVLGSESPITFLEPPLGDVIEKTLRQCGLWNPASLRALPVRVWRRQPFQYLWSCSHLRGYCPRVIRFRACIFDRLDRKQFPPVP